jgi:uncharacterized coiled-coil protein SlyX
MNASESIAELQIKLSFQDQLLEVLNRQVSDQELRLSKLILQVQALSAQVKTLEAGTSSGAASSNHEIPPHY